jgi:putative DNA primase/helicase
MMPAGKWTIDGQAQFVARALGGHRSGNGYLVRCPVAGHGRGRGDRRPSLLIRDGDKRLLVHCFSGCDPHDVLDVLKARGLLSGPVDISIPNAHGAASYVQVSADPRAAEMWSSAKPIVGTPAARYLEVHRRLGPPYPATLRFASAAHHPRHRLVMPALVAAVQAPDRQLTAVQLTFLRAGGGKAEVFPVRWTIGQLGGGAVRLGPAERVLGIAEGTEDALAASQLSQVACWASLGSERMHRVFLPGSVRELHIFADDDGPGLRAAERTAEVHRDLGRRVLVRVPPKGFKDWGEIAARSDKPGIAA